MSRCPHCSADALRCLGSNPARFNGEVIIAFTCEECDRDSQWKIARDKEGVIVGIFGRHPRTIQPFDEFRDYTANPL